MSTVVPCVCRYDAEPCSLLNHLFPAQPPYIARVNISEDGIVRATNVTRFISACQTVGLVEKELFAPTDMVEASEASLGRVCGSITSLARLAGKTQAAVGASKSPVRSRSPTRPTSRPSSPGVRFSPPSTPRIGVIAGAVPSRRSSRDLAPSPAPSLRAGAASAARASESTNDLHAKLQTASRPTSPVTIPESPVSSVFDDSTFGRPMAHVVVGTPTRPKPPPRSATQPPVSPLSIRPKSPTPISPSQSPGRSPSLVLRPTLRPRHTTGSRVQVSFAEGGSGLPRSSSIGTDRSSSSTLGLHVRERTPSLISSGSRATSGYNRSSAALSVSTVIGDEFAAVDVVEEDEEQPSFPHNHLRARRMSEKTLHEARQKILGTLLSSEDLPSDLREAVRQNAATPTPTPTSGHVPTPTPIDDARGIAISRSLAALEGNRESSRGVFGSSPGRRPAVRRGQSVDVPRQDVTRVLEEDEQSSSLSSSESQRTSLLLRRPSANGKVYVPKRSLSPVQPTSRGMSGRALPASAPSSPPLRRTSLYASTSSLLDGPSRSTMERWQSDIYPSSKGTVSSDGSNRPMQLRINSMVNLPSASSSSLLRDTSSSSGTAVKASQPLQVLEINEPGLPPIRYVS